MQKAKFGDKEKMYSSADLENSEAVRREVETDPSLENVRRHYCEGTNRTVRGNYMSFVKRDGKLYREFITPRGHERFQFVVPEKYRYAVFKLGHCDATGAHSSRKKTWKRIAEKFYWPGMGHDLSRWVHSCEVCQNTNDSDIELYEPHELNEEPIGCLEGIRAHSP
ncbi:hypothetical protein GWK47_054991 [Chionoecetes opilio]|uniref:RNA-directed DNA polymerase n=1 Tax=Chionoecetes opilio TaxID=41210 RepID=A0A8J4XZX9_CHIOP|nr:hypothetical protein GWK47_054991 [Chionoecetes opilio]